MLRSPPAKLISKAVTPRVAPAKRALSKAIAKAGIKPKVPAANIVTILESPSLAPGGIIGRGGIRFSKAESTIAKAPSTARVVSRRVFFLISAMVFLLMGRDASNEVLADRMSAVRIS